jgi:hypothetical protein
MRAAMRHSSIIRLMGRSTLQLAALGIGIIIILGTGDAFGRQSAAARTLDAASPITYFIGDGSPRSGFRPADRQLATWAFQAWERSSAQQFRFQPSAAESTAVVRLYWAESSEGQYGEMRPLIVGGKRGAAVYIRPDIDALGEDIARRARVDPLLRDSIVYLTCLHELGHALGLTHTSDFRDIMYFFGFGGDIVEYFERYRRQLRSRDDIAAFAGASAADISRLRAMYAR